MFLFSNTLCFRCEYYTESFSKVNSKFAVLCCVFATLLFFRLLSQHSKKKPPFPVEIGG